MSTALVREKDDSRLRSLSAWPPPSGTRVRSGSPSCTDSSHPRGTFCCSVWRKSPTTTSSTEIARTGVWERQRDSSPPASTARPERVLPGNLIVLSTPPPFSSLQIEGQRTGSAEPVVHLGGKRQCACHAGQTLSRRGQRSQGA